MGNVAPQVTGINM